MDAASDWLIKSQLLSGDSEAKTGDFNFSDNKLTELNFEIRDTLTSTKSNEYFKEESKILEKKFINPKAVNDTNVTAKVTINPKTDVSEDSLFSFKTDKDSDSVGSIKLEFELKEGFKWKGIEGKSPKIIFNLEADANYNILNPLDEFLKVSGTSNKEYLLVGSQLSNENQTWKGLSKKLATLPKSEKTEYDQDDGVSNPKTESLNDKRVNVLTSVFKDITFNDKSKNFDANKDNTVAKEAQKVEDKAKESIKSLFKDMNLFNMVHAKDTGNNLGDITYGTSLFAEFLNLDYLFNVADVYLEVSSTKKENVVPITKSCSPSDEYTIDSYSYDLQVVFKLKTDAKNTAGENKWNGLKESAPIRVLFENIYDTNTSLGLDSIIDESLENDTSNLTAKNEFEFSTSIEEDILTDKSTDEQSALVELYDLILVDTKIFSDDCDAKYEIPSLDSSNKANLDNREHGVDILVSTLIKKMKTDFTFGNDSGTDILSDTPNKDAVMLDWVFSDRITTNLTVSDTTKFVKTDDAKTFKFDFEFQSKTGFGWSLDDKNAEYKMKPIKLSFSLTTKPASSSPSPYNK